MERQWFKWLPVIDAELCTSCRACVDACGPGCLTIPEQRTAVLTNPDACGSEEHCIAPCPEHCITMEWIPWRGDIGRGVWTYRDPVHRANEPAGQ